MTQGATANTLIGRPVVKNRNRSNQRAPTLDMTAPLCYKDIRLLLGVSKNYWGCPGSTFDLDVQH